MGSLRSFLPDQLGAIAPILGLSAIVLFGAVALAIDSARIYMARSSIKGAADSAVLSAVSVSAQDLSRKQRRQMAKMYFYANCEDKCGDVKDVKIRFQDGGETVKISARSELPTSLGRVLGMASMTANVESVASMNLGHAELHLFLDNSESMNIPNTDADIQRFIDVLDQELGHRTWAGKGCMFACHGTSETTADGRSYYEVSRDHGIDLRQDYVRRSAIEMFEAISQHKSGARFNFGIYSFDVSISTKLDVTNDLDAVRNTLEAHTGASNYTDFRQTTGEMQDIVGEGGSGSSEEDPIKVVVLVTDGAQNIGETEHGTIDAAECEVMKESGTQIVTLHLIYGDVRKYHGGIAYKVEPYEQDRFDQLQACASPGLYFEANQGASISEAFEDIADAIMKRTPRLVN